MVQPRDGLQILNDHCIRKFFAYDAMSFNIYDYLSSGCPLISYQVENLEGSPLEGNLFMDDL